MTDEVVEKYIAELEAENQELEKQLFAMQTVLALVLAQLGEPVTLTHEEVVSGLPEGTQIFIDEDPESFEHTLGLKYPEIDNLG